MVNECTSLVLLVGIFDSATRFDNHKCNSYKIQSSSAASHFILPLISMPLCSSLTTWQHTIRRCSLLIPGCCAGQSGSSDYTHCQQDWRAPRHNGLPSAGDGKSYLHHDTKEITDYFKIPTSISEYKANVLTSSASCTLSQKHQEAVVSRLLTPTWLNGWFWPIK